MDPSSSWCIVALPEEGHPVYKVSSEKVPHLTLLFLGESKEPAKAIRIIEAIQHTIKTSFSTKFSLGVERRGTLGDDQADVLFFYKDEAGRVRDFRSLLLKNDDIKQAYDSTFQYPEWTPHLTLGYPNNPAKPIPDDSHSISWITFDRIALWLEDSDGPEIRLDTYDPMTESVEQMHHTERMIQKGMMAMVDSDDFLEHYGVKGMRWGKRKAPDAAKVAAKAGRKAERSAIVKNLGTQFNTTSTSGRVRTGATVAGALLATPVANIYMGAKVTRASGYSKGASVAVGLIGGTPGALVLAEVSARSRAKKG